MVTIKEVAKEANVSIKTVSRVVNREDSVSEDMRKRVQKAIDHLNYHPNQIAKMMRQQKSNFVGIISDAAVTTPWATEMIGAIQNRLQKAGKIPLIISASVKDPDFETQLTHLFTQQASGIIYASMYHKKIRFDHNLYPNNTVLCNCFDEKKLYPSVTPDDYQGGYDAVQHLIDQGYKKIAYLGLTTTEVAGKLRYKAFKDAMDKNNIPIDVDNIFIDPPLKKSNPHFATETAYRLLSHPNRPNAFVVGNDLMALQVWGAAAQLGLNVGQDFAVIGYDDFKPITQNIYPQLSTIRLPHYQMGKIAAEIFLNLTENKINEHSLIRCPLIRRASVPTNITLDK